MTLAHGFRKLESREIPEIHTQATLWRHEATGAQLLSLVNEDENKVFGVSFRTPPPDGTGVAHILEHSVLCGSRRYPVKEPFVELIKGSLNTFLNAFTYPDKTCYPVASANLADLHNLIDVYLDAVFHPLLPERVLRQEGWRAEPDSGALVFKGVVLNEMKGAYSSPDDLLSVTAQRSLFPDTVYGLDSGGDPERIPDLSYQGFIDFHKAYYHPGNAYFFFHGDDPEDARLERINAALEGFGPRDVRSEIPLQPAFTEPRRVRKGYGVEPDAPGAKAGRADKRSMLVVNWMLPEAGDLQANLTLQILEALLIGIPASPLRKALIDSGLGEDIAGGGLELELRQMYFSVGLKGVSGGRLNRVEPLVFGALEKLAKDGIPGEVIEAAVNSVEFALRENNTGRYPRGLHLMLRSLTSWLYGGDPFSPLGFETTLRAIKERLAAGEPLFENVIESYLLRNPHRSTVILEPDPALLPAAEAREKERLAELRRQLGEEGVKRLAVEAEELKRVQETPDAPEDLARIPRLKPRDLAPENTRIPCEASSVGASMILAHDLDTSGIVYLDLAFDLGPLLAQRPELAQLVPLFGRCLLDMGTTRRSYVDMNMWIARKTGGVDPLTLGSSMLGARAEAPPVTRFVLRGKATLDNLDALLEILSEMLLEVRLDDRARFKQLALEEKAGMEERAIPAGHQMTASRLMARLSRAGRFNEMCGGPSQLFFLKRLAKTSKAEWPGVLAALETLRGLLVTRASLVANLTVDPAARPRAQARLESFLAGLPAAPSTVAGPKGFGPAFRKPLWPAPGIPDYEAFVIPAGVNFVGKAVNLYAQGYEPHGAAQVASRILRNGYLWDRVRVQGGAYGAFCLFERLSGNFAFLSYRDPNVKRTLDAFDAAAASLSQLALPGDELEKNVVGAIGDLDAHMLPDAKGYSSLVRWLVGDEDAQRQRLREEILTADPARIRAFGQSLESVAREGRITVVGALASIEDASDKHWKISSLL
jgi:Zn-dependent M16 (insulinase) family peptidase